MPYPCVLQGTSYVCNGHGITECQFCNGFQGFRISFVLDRAFSTVRARTTVGATAPRATLTSLKRPGPSHFPANATLTTDIANDFRCPSLLKNETYSLPSFGTLTPRTIS